jgi:glycerol-3-phosphate acyltransferase PlsY
MTVLGPAVAAALAAYLLGSIPVGVLLCKLQGVDPRLVGSGRTGGTNVYRAAGMPTALLTVAGDIFKGYVAVELARFLVPAGDYAAWAHSLAALAAILGHNYSAFLRFTGGAGSTPNLGALLAIAPVVALIGLALGVAIVFGLRLASVASLVVSLVVAAGVLILVTLDRLAPGYLFYGFGQLALLAWALRPNIARLLRGAERRIDFGGE